MLTDLYAQNPYQDSYIFYRLTPNVPMRYETVEGQLEKMLALLLGREVRKAIDNEWRDLAKAVAAKVNLEAGEMLAIQAVNIDTDQNCLIFRYSYSFGAKKVVMNKYTERRVIPMDKPTLRRLVSICDKTPNSFILCGTEQETPIHFDQLDSREAKKLLNGLWRDRSTRTQHLFPRLSAFFQLHWFSPSSFYRPICGSVIPCLARN